MSADLVHSELEAERAYWQTRLASLETLLCELLVKNEKLRQERLRVNSEQADYETAQTESSKDPSTRPIGVCLKSKSPRDVYIA